MRIPTVENLRSPKGKPVANQYLIYTDKGVYFQSYSTVIAHRDFSGKVTLDRRFWDVSVTTSKYRSIFLEESTAETRRKIESGEYRLENLI